MAMVDTRKPTKILTLNSGSSSIKYSLWEIPGSRRICSGIIERVGPGSSKISYQGSESLVSQCECPNHDVGIRLVIEGLTDPKSGALTNMSEVGAVAHRVVHGGQMFNRSVRIDDRVINAIEECSVLAPLHNPPNTHAKRT